MCISGYRYSASEGLFWKKKHVPVHVYKPDGGVVTANLLITESPEKVQHWLLFYVNTGIRMLGSIKNQWLKFSPLNSLSNL